MRNDFLTKNYRNINFHLLPSKKYSQNTIAVRVRNTIWQNLRLSAKNQ